MRLIQGNEPLPRLMLIFNLTQIKSEPVREALTDHLCKGHSETTACQINDVSRSNFNRGLARVNSAAETVEQIKELDWCKFKSVK